MVWCELLTVGAVVPYDVGAGVRGRSPEPRDRALDSRSGRDFGVSPSLRLTDIFPMCPCILIIPGLAGFYLETKRGLLMGSNSNQLQTSALMRQEPQAGPKCMSIRRLECAAWLAMLAGCRLWYLLACQGLAGPC